MRDTATERERYLDSELERTREELRSLEAKHQEREEAERRRRREEMEQRIAEDERTAETWPEALQKQICLSEREITGDDEQCDRFFRESASACRKALEFWREVEAAQAPRIKALEEQIAALRDSIRLEVAAKLESAVLTREARGRRCQLWQAICQRYAMT